jgi:hypothetical protein
VADPIPFRLAQENQRLEREIAELRRQASEQPVDGGPGGPHGPVMTPWQQSVESRLTALDSKLDNHLKWLLIAFAGGFLVLGGLILQQTASLSQKVEGVGSQVSDLRVAIARQEGAGAPSSVARMPPCKNGAAECRPWERAW